MNLKQRIVVIIADIMLLACLTVSIYHAHKTPEEIAFEFLKVFIPMVIGTLVLARIFFRKFQTVDVNPADTSPVPKTGKDTDYYLFN